MRTILLSFTLISSIYVIHSKVSAELQDDEAQVLVIKKNGKQKREKSSKLRDEIILLSKDLIVDSATLSSDIASLIPDLVRVLEQYGAGEGILATADIETLRLHTHNLRELKSAIQRIKDSILLYDENNKKLHKC